uniref:Uncharacterized protein n=1 Tax=Arundo donax TaxID=35708 RepID=A0A0A9EDM6_ARUDO
MGFSCDPIVCAEWLTMLFFRLHCSQSPFCNSAL